MAERVAGLMWRLRRAERCEAVSVLADQAELEIPARPRTRGSILIDDEENMPDAELLAEREKSVIAAREQLTKFGLAGDLADRIADLADATPIDAGSALAFVSACAEQAESIGCNDPPDSEDVDAMLEAAGLPADDGPAGPAWTAGAVRRAVATFASAMYDKQTPDWLVNEVAEFSASWLQNARTRLEEDEPEALTLRKRVTLTDAVARARRTGVNAMEAAHIVRYEGHLQRQLTQALDDLERLHRLGRDRADVAA